MRLASFWGFEHLLFSDFAVLEELKVLEKEVCFQTFYLCFLRSC